VKTDQKKTLRASASSAVSLSSSKFFLPYQAAWIKDNARLKLMEKARQIGLSWSSAYRTVSQASTAGARYDSWVSSRDDIQARLFLEDCKAFAGILNVAASDLGERVIDDERRLTARVLEFANGRSINSMSSNPNAQAGKRGSRLLDEFALHPDPRLLYAIAYPGITWGGSMEIVSTHRGTANFFNDLVEEIKHKGNPKGFSLHTVTLVTALDQGFLGKLKAKLPPEDPRQQMDEAAYFDFIRAGCPDEETFQQEYMCRPSDDKSAFLTYDEIAACCYPGDTLWEVPREELARETELYLGVDVGRDHDLTVFWLLSRIAGAWFTRRVITLQAQTFAAQEAELYSLLELPNLRRCCIDQTGIGRQFTERAQERFGEYKVEGVSFTGPVKEALAYPLRAAFEDKTIRIPRDRAIESDLRAVKKDTTAAGNIRFVADRGKNGHADRFWALALALHAGGSKTPAPPPVVPSESYATEDRRSRSVAV
jgi:phage FluMu gp28-like protein